MKQLYAKTLARLKHIFCLALALTVLSACGGSVYSQKSWESNTGVITQDPTSLPNIAWQTPRQRAVLTKQDALYARAQKESPAAALQQDQNRPSLQTIFGQNEKPAAVPPGGKVSIALLVPLTGKHAPLGQSMLKAAQMALFDVGGTSIELLPRDTKSTTAGAVAAARAAIKSGTHLLLGPVFSEDVAAVKHVTAGTDTPMVAFSTDWTLAGNGTYILGFLPFAQVTRVTQYAQRHGYRRFAAFAPRTEYADVAIGTLQRSSGSFIRKGRYDPAATDISIQVEIFAAGLKSQIGEGEDTKFYNALMLPVGGQSLRSVVSLLDAQGITNEQVRLLGTGLWDDSSLTSNPSLYGGWFAAPDPALRRDFEKRYKRNYSAHPLRISSLAYDATALAAVLARSDHGGTPFSHAQMTHARGFAGIDGIFRFRPDGLSERGLAIIEIQQGKAQVIDPAPTAFISGS